MQKSHRNLGIYAAREQHLWWTRWIPTLWDPTLFSNFSISCLLYPSIQNNIVDLFLGTWIPSILHICVSIVLSRHSFHEDKNFPLDLTQREDEDNNFFQFFFSFFANVESDQIFFNRNSGYVKYGFWFTKRKPKFKLDILNCVKVNRS